MRKLAILAAAVALVATALPAQAQRGFGRGDAIIITRVPLRVVPQYNPNARIIEVRPEEQDTTIKRETREEWTARCKPTLSPADPVTGMRSWSWAEKDCLYGPRQTQ